MSNYSTFTIEMLLPRAFLCLAFARNKRSHHLL